MLRAFGAFETTPMVRVPGQDRDYLKRVLDAGAQALMIPMIETADQARCSRCRVSLPTFGFTRMCGRINPCFWLWAADNYITTAHDELFIALAN